MSGHKPRKNVLQYSYPIQDFGTGNSYRGLLGGTICAKSANVHYFFHFDSSLVARSAAVLSISANWRTWCSRVYRFTMLKRSQMRPAWRVVENQALPEETTSRAIVF